LDRSTPTRPAHGTVGREVRCIAPPADVGCRSAEGCASTWNDEAAAEWLTRNGFTEDAAGVLNPRPAGRPSIGPLVSVRLPEALVDELDELAGEDKKKRADVIRELLEEGVARRATENRTR